MISCRQKNSRIGRNESKPAKNRSVYTGTTSKNTELYKRCRELVGQSDRWFIAIFDSIEMAIAS